MYKNIIFSVASICSLSCMVHVVCTQAVNDRDLRHQVVQAVRANNQHAVTQDTVARITAEVRKRVVAKTIEKQQQQDGVKRVRKIIDKETKKSESVEIEPSAVPVLSAAEARVARAEDKAKRRQSNKALSKEEKIQQATDMLKKATVRDNELKAKAQEQGFDTNQLTEEGYAKLEEAKVRQAQVDEKAKQLGIDKNVTIQKARDKLAEATARHNEIYG